jgi:mono/diheme cytochrome c family protein
MAMHAPMTFVARRLTTIAFLVVIAGASSGQEIGDAEHGGTVASDVCAQCHAVLAGDKGSSNPKAPPFETVANMPGMTAIALTAWLQSSHPTMPNIKLSDTDTKDVIQYILSLKQE